MPKSVLIVVAIGLLIAAVIGARLLMRTTVTGQLIDLACYDADHSNTGMAHKNRGLACARACALEGFPVGLLTSDGRVYQVTGGLAANSNAKLVPYMTETVTISGSVSDQEGHMLIAAGDLKTVKE